MRNLTCTLPALGLGLILAACSESGNGESILVVSTAGRESCMSCHNGSTRDDYSGPGMENPHPFPGGGTLKCTTCHGGNPGGNTQMSSHVPPPPEIGDRDRQARNNHAYFNRLTLTGIDKFPDYTVDGRTYSALDYLQFINPGDLRVVNDGRSCGDCHIGHTESVSNSLLATEAGILSGALYALGIDNRVAANAGLHQDTAADVAFRATSNPDYVPDPTRVGAVGQLAEFPVHSVRGANGPLDIDENPLFNSPDLPLGLRADNTVIPDSPLAILYHEQVAFTCGDCHLGSAGANNRYGDFRSSGCTACHMRYSLDGRSRISDPRVNKLEPFDPDDIDAPERPHVKRHLITSVSRALTTGEVVEGMDDYTCAGCHQGSNRTVMQYWGIRLDQNEDVRRRRQYPANPDTFQTTADDPRLFDPVVNNLTFNGRNPRQYLLFEDYDGDGRDDTPPDVHYAAGLGCIDCHGSHDLHGSDIGDRDDVNVFSRQEQAVAIRCESCHGGISSYAATAIGTGYDGVEKELAIDSEGNVLRHVVREADGVFYLTSRLTGRRHYVPQTKDVVVKSTKTHPGSGSPLYNAKGSYAMGRWDDDPATGTGPIQAVGTASGFSHTDNMSCVSCHASWTNNCIGCHLVGEYDRNNNFSNITGDRTVFEEQDAQFVYQSPVPFQLGVTPRNEIAPYAGNSMVFFRYEDLNQEYSKVFSFSDRNGGGNNPGAGGRNAFGSLSHNAMMPHSIRGRVGPQNEGPRYCVACHLTENSVASFRPQYDVFRAAMATNDFASLDYDLLEEHIGQNPGNHLDSPIWVHMVSGLGSGLFLFDDYGCAVNPLDNNDQQFGCENRPPDTVPPDQRSPKDRFVTDGFTKVMFDLDRIVQANGVSNGSNNHPLLDSSSGSSLRDGALDPNLSGPLGRTIIEMLSDPDTGLVLDSWIDADGQLRGAADSYVE